MAQLALNWDLPVSSIHPRTYSTILYDALRIAKLFRKLFHLIPIGNAYEESQNRSNSRNKLVEILRMFTCQKHSLSFYRLS